MESKNTSSGFTGLDHTEDSHDMVQGGRDFNMSYTKSRMRVKYNSVNINPPCHNPSGGDSTYSDLCLCLLEDGGVEIGRFFQEDYEDIGKWNCRKGKVAGWVLV